MDPVDFLLELIGDPLELATLRARFGLTKKEAAVAQLAALRLSDGEIAERLTRGAPTVAGHLSRVRDKMGARRRRELLAIALRGTG